MSDKDKLHTGELYQPMDPEILEKVRDDYNFRG